MKTMSVLGRNIGGDMKGIPALGGIWENEMNVNLELEGDGSWYETQEHELPRCYSIPDIWIKV